MSEATLVPRMQLVEIHDTDYCPAICRDLLTSSLSYLWDERGHPFANNMSPIRLVAPVLAEAVKRCGASRVIDLCSGSGGPIHHLVALPELKGVVETFVLTDLYPNVDRYQELANTYPGRVTYIKESVDAKSNSLIGFRTMFASFHHMEPELAINILKDAVHNECGFAAFEFQARHVLALIAMILFAQGHGFKHAFTLKDKQIPRVLLSLLIPIVPFIMWFDGIVSSLRTYTPDEFMELAKAADPEEKFTWEAKELKLAFYFPVTYYVGIPKSATELR